MKIVLIGFMCSGKSSVGRLLSKRLGWPFFDTDELVEKQVGGSVADIIRTQGEPAFRDVEKKAVQLISLSDSCVISTGGGVPMDPDNMKDLSRNGEIIWLKVSPETVLKRAGNAKSRPLIDPQDPLASIRKRMNERASFYSQAAHSIETDLLSQQEIVEKIMKLIPSILK